MHRLQARLPGPWLTRGFSRLSHRGQLLASTGGAAAAVWETVNALAARPGMLNMGQGFPDYPGSAVARAEASAAIESGLAGVNQYSPQAGLPALRQSIADFYQRRYNARYDPGNQVAVTAGAQETLAAAFLAFLDPGDEVLIFEPFYPFMMGAIRLAGAVPRVVQLRPPFFQIEEAAVEAAVRASGGRLKMVVVNSPHNPTGHCASPAELEIVARVCRENDLIAVSDEVYENSVYDGAHHRLAHADGMADRVISVSSGGKLFALTGWRVAWAVGSADLVQPLSQAHTHMTFNAPTPLQVGIGAALDAEDELELTAPLFRGNFELLSEALLAGTPVKNVCEAQGGYFLVAETDGRTDVEFCAMLAEQKSVACTPMSVFYSNPEARCELVRFTVCKSREFIEEACRSLKG